MKYTITIDSQASVELHKAVEYYETILTGLGFQFINEFEKLLENLSIRPHSFGFFDEIHRRALLYKFPYIVFFEILDETVLIVRVRHTSQDSKELFSE